MFNSLRQIQKSQLMKLQLNPNLDLKTHDNDYVENEFLSFNMLKHQKMPTLQAWES